MIQSLSLILLSCFLILAELPHSAEAAAPLPRFRVETKGFKASEADIKNLLDSATLELWKHFPNYPLDPIVITRGNDGPIVLYKRNSKDEIVVRLDTSGSYWSQYSYQWAHEFCHILCGFRPDGRENKWFEETLCELASLYVMRSMAKTWESKPPYPNWKNYRHSLQTYADNVIAKREKITPFQLDNFYRKHATSLRKDSTQRHLNGAMAAALLPLFEEKPEHWEAIRWLNTKPATKGMSFARYLKKWHDSVPHKHKSFVKKISKLYGVSV
ncbi:hypothetical protein HW115_12430 [Verrucomicrobiaceae bacterium N1E253]|uniref:IrrE N-terminal-like domain-containing protein n=1 Tax=Oceaniferula marina TaxID=2748318 RepID=A0A851GHR8_9BACT|nr:hypothetical protein [Oceaniferula marina]NWK56422.1 hypothetical protein [Oceaniferula marina]